MSSIIKGITDEQHITKKEPEVHVPGYGTMPLDMLKRHVQELSKDFNTLIQQGAFLKAAYRSEQFYNALMALAKALPKPDKVDETHSTGTTVGSAGIGGGVGLGIDKSPIEKVIEKPLGEGELPPKAGFNKKPHKVGPGTSKDDYEYKNYIPRDRKEKGEEWAIARDVRNVNSKVGKKKPKELDTGFYKSYLSNRPVREGEVVSLEARRSPLVVAGSPYDWDIYDLRTNKMVANILGGDRHESPLYEIRIRSSGMTPTTRMKPTYVLRAGRNNNPPYKAYELVDTPERYGKIEKSPGPGGTTKLRPDEDDMLRHMFKVMGGGKYYGYDLNLVEEGLDQYEIIEKALGAKIMEIDDAMELGYTDWDPEDSSSIVYLGNQKNEGYSYKIPAIKADAVGGTVGEEQAPMFTPEENLSELKQDTIDDYISRKSALARGGLPEPSKKFGNVKAPAWKVAAGKIAKPGSEMEKYAKVKATLEDEAKIVNANDPRSDGWRVYDAVPAGTKESAIMKGLQTEYKDAESKRVIQFSKENPPSLDYLYQQFIQKMLNPANTVDPNEWIESVNNYYGLNYIWKDYQKRGHKDYTNNWQKIVDKYILKR